MRDLLDQIENALNFGLYYIALIASLSIPDICGAIESTDGKATRKKYQEWFDKYVAPKYCGMLTGEDCYFFIAAFDFKIYFSANALADPVGLQFFN